MLLMVFQYNAGGGGGFREEIEIECDRRDISTRDSTVAHTDL